jgi:hypothetical protein
VGGRGTASRWEYAVRKIPELSDLADQRALDSVVHAVDQDDADRDHRHGDAEEQHQDRVNEKTYPDPGQWPANRTSVTVAHRIPHWRNRIRKSSATGKDFAIAAG